ncbi:DUF1963 domain-containing protein [Marivita hallyeonensis]|uniref:Uncharacterized protein n=1 Tax=Marivita hallyeonensis TaxID=996342 RepID=A0A1M5P9M9_9RHOB|nr:DUF1963 domain-containing protein [Marivita hallyeonensis]SHG98159.1 protein of unknown function [Marivita hallyeonensis]
MIAKFRAKQNAIMAERMEDRPGWWEPFSCDHAPSVNIRFDVQLRRWMGYARVSQKREMTEADKEAFVALLRFVDSMAQDEEPADLKIMGIFKHHEARRSFLQFMVRNGFHAAARDLKHLHPDRSAEPKHDFGDADVAARQVQMFGAGYLMQHAAILHEDKVMLFQLACACGVEMVDGVLQMWITEDDLAHARFDKVVSTMECT